MENGHRRRARAGRARAARKRIVILSAPKQSFSASFTSLARLDRAGRWRQGYAGRAKACLNGHNDFRVRRARSPRFRISSRTRELASSGAMLPFKLVYHERYDLNLGPHVFPSEKIPVDLRNACFAKASPRREIFCGQILRATSILRVHIGGLGAQS